MDTISTSNQRGLKRIVAWREPLAEPSVHKVHDAASRPDVGLAEATAPLRSFPKTRARLHHFRVYNTDARSFRKPHDLPKRPDLSARAARPREELRFRESGRRGCSRLRRCQLQFPIPIRVSSTPARRGPWLKKPRRVKPPTRSRWLRGPVGVGLSRAEIENRSEPDAPNIGNTGPSAGGVTLRVPPGVEKRLEPCLSLAVRPR